MENDPGLTMVLAPGLVLLILGIAFLRDRILYIKKGHIAIATMFKREERKDSEGDIFYIPFFKYTTCSNQEIIFEHRSTQEKYKWTIGDKIKVAYHESILDISNPLPLLFYDTFGLSALLMTVGIFLLTVSGGIYWEASDNTFTYLVPAITVPFVLGFYIWTQKFFRKFTVNDGA
jgi:hypothetical protein